MCRKRMQWNIVENVCYYDARIKEILQTVNQLEAQLFEARNRCQRTEMTLAASEMQRPYTSQSFRHRVNDFERLMRQFTFHDVEATPEERRQMITDHVHFEHFCSEIRYLFGEDLKSQYLKLLFRKIQTNPDAKIDWSELFGYSQEEKVKDESRGGAEESVFMVTRKQRVGDAAGDKKRRDTVQALHLIPKLDSFISASQKGTIALWNSKLRLNTSVELNETSWVTGCCFLPTIRRVAVCTERSLAIWDFRSKSKNQNVFIIKPIDDPIYCICTVPPKDDIDPSSSAGEDRLLFGDDQGYVNSLTLAQKDLTTKKSKLKEAQNTRSVTLELDSLSYKIQRRKFHDGWVVKVAYIHELQCFASCSPSSKQSFVLEELDILRTNAEPRGFAVPKGVNAFCFCSKANIIATGGVDKIIRVWHPHIFSKPSGKLVGHLFTVSNIVVNEKDQHLISLSTARVVRVWDIHTLTCLQVFTDSEERPGEKRIYSLFMDEKHERLVTGSSEIDAWPLTRAVQDTMQVPHTHDRAISQVLFNSELNQLATICSEGIIRVWEADVGKLVYIINESHGSGVEVTSACLDKSGYRLATAASDGSLKVWDFGSGQEIKNKSGREGAADNNDFIRTMTFVQVGAERCILALGWQNRLRLLLDSQENYDIPVLRDLLDVAEIEPASRRSSRMSYRSEPQVSRMKTEINVLQNYELRSLCSCNDGVFATGTTSGSVVLWNIHQGSVQQICDFVAPMSLETDAEPVSSSPTSSHQRRKRHQFSANALVQLQHRTHTLDPEYLETLMRRDSDANAEDHPDDQKPDEQTSEIDRQDSIATVARAGPPVVVSDPGEDHMITTTYPAILCSVHQDAGIRFWNSKGLIIKEVTNEKLEFPLTACCTDQDATLLCVGDNKGYITLWEVGPFLETADCSFQADVSELVYWKAHTARIVTLHYLENQRAIISSSIDGSVRVWFGTQGRFVGFYGQHKAFNFPFSDEGRSSTPTLPYDISEAPIIPVKRKNKGESKAQFEYPLIFDNSRWRQPGTNSIPDNNGSIPKSPEDKKFFEALIKPKAYNDHLQGSVSGDRLEGAVFRALPVYRVSTPKHIQMPKMTMNSKEDEEESMLFGAKAKKSENQKVRMVNKRPSVPVGIGSSTRSNSFSTRK